MERPTNKSIFLARVMGLFLLILSLSLLINANNFIPTVNAIFQNGALQFVIGMMLVTIGALLVVSHNVWNTSWVVIITILSWLVLIKGTLYLMFPACVQAMAQQYNASSSGIYMGSAINLLIGIYLLYKGFFAASK